MTQVDRHSVLPEEFFDATDAFCLTLPVASDVIEKGRNALFDYLGMRDLADETANRIDVIFEEIVGNIVRHASEPTTVEAAQSLTVRALFRPADILMVFEDDGPAFDPRSVADPAPFTSLENAEVGGLGLPLIRRFSSQIDYRRLTSAPDGRDAINQLVVKIKTG